MRSVVVASCLVALTLALSSCTFFPLDPPPAVPLPSCDWDVTMIDPIAESREVLPLGSSEVYLEGEGIACVIPAIVKDVPVLESALLFCEFGDSEYQFAAEMQVDPRSELSERKREFILRRHRNEPYRLLLACN